MKYDLEIIKELALELAEILEENEGQTSAWHRFLDNLTTAFMTHKAIVAEKQTMWLPEYNTAISEALKYLNMFLEEMQNKELSLTERQKGKIKIILGNYFKSGASIHPSRNNHKNFEQLGNIENLVSFIRDEIIKINADNQKKIAKLESPNSFKSKK